MKALIIIDMGVKDVKKRRDKGVLIKNQLKLIKAFNDARQLVILTGGAKSGRNKPTTNPVMLRLWGNELSKNPEENKLIPELLHSDYDYYIVKPEYSAFYKTRLENICRKRKINELYFAGIYSGCCVYFTAADAAMRGIQPYLVSDASGAPNAKIHKKNIAKYSDVLGPVLSTNQVIKKIKPASHNL